MTTLSPHAHRQSKYLTDPLVAGDEAGYTVEDGIVIDTETRQNMRAYDEWTRYWRKTPAEKEAEEAAWAARSGPVTIIRKGKTA